MPDPREPERPVYSPPAGRPVRLSWLIAGGVVALLLIVASFYYTAQWYDARSGNRLMVAMAADIADEHRRALPIKLTDPDPDPDAALRELGAVDAATVRTLLHGSGETLLGSRSVRLDGYPAAQLICRLPDGSHVTRYVAVVPAGQLRGLPDQADRTPLLVAGVTVSIWRARGLVFAEAR